MNTEQLDLFNMDTQPEPPAEQPAPVPHDAAVDTLRGIIAVGDVLQARPGSPKHLAQEIVINNILERTGIQAAGGAVVTWQMIDEFYVFAGISRLFDVLTVGDWIIVRNPKSVHSCEATQITRMAEDRAYMGEWRSATKDAINTCYKLDRRGH